MPNPGHVNREICQEWKADQDMRRAILNATIDDLAEYLYFDLDVEREEAFLDSLTVDDLLGAIEVELNESKQRQRNHDRTLQEFRLGFLEAERREKMLRRIPPQGCSNKTHLK